MIVDATAHLLYASFQTRTRAWPTIASAREEVALSFAEGKNSRVMLDRNSDAVVGWIGAIPSYDGNVWEIHPVVVSEAMRGQGLGRLLNRRP